MAIQYLKITTIAIVGVGATFLLYKGEYTPAVGLFGSILGYVFGNTQLQRERRKYGGV